MARMCPLTQNAGLSQRKNTMRTIDRTWAWTSWAVLVAIVVLQLPLILNPGYFSHDELQWAAFADQGQSVASVWAQVDTFQYRPVTFSLWLWLSSHLFEHPQAFHGVMVVWGALNAVLLARLMVRLGVGGKAAFAGAVVFAMSAFAVQTHGWAGTLADLIWVSCALLAGRLAVGGRPGWQVFAGAALLTTVGLLSKESAIVIPALAALGWLFLGRGRNWAMATAGALLPTLVWLALRVQVILFSPREASNYEWSAWFIPLRWLEYQLYTPLVTRAGIHNLFPKNFDEPRVWVAMALWLALAWTFWRAGPRWLWAFLLVGAAALGPVLILAESSNQYGYGFAAAVAALGAAVWAHAGRGGRIVLVLCATLSVWHGVNMMRSMHEVGTIQSRFSPAVATVVANASTYPVRIRPAHAGQDWIYLRLTHQIPQYRGVPIGDRVQLVAMDAPADYVIAKDGTLSPAK